MVLRHCVLALVIIIAKTSTISCVQKGSLGFVIDDTKSMDEDISKVREAVDGIMDIILNNPTSQIKDVVLVTFNDPKWLTKLYETKTKDQLKNALKRIKVHGGGDCPEYSMTGIIMALENSQPNSYLFVFTDAPPKDQELIAKVIRIAQSKSSQIYFVRTPGIQTCRDKHPESDFKSYYDIAAATFGQVFNCGTKKEVEDILKYVKVVISGGGNTVKRVDVAPNKLTHVPFNIDDQTEYVVVSASGINVELDIVAGPTRKYEKITWIDNAKVIKIDNPDPGDYTAAVRGTSTTSILVFARTDFTFQYGFSETVPAAFNNDKLQPTDGVKYHLLVNVTDPANSVDIKYAEFLTQTENVIVQMPLRKQRDNYYVTDSIVSPNSTFLIAINGVGKITRKAIRRTAKTPVHSRPKNSDPIIQISQPGVVQYNAPLQLTCTVNAYPKPEIVWKDENGNKFPKLQQRTHDLDRYRYVSELKIEHMKKSQAIYCFAGNQQGESSKHVMVTVQSPFIVGNQREITTTTVEYGQSYTVNCNIKSSFPMQITWYYNEKEIAGSIKYSISEGGTKLQIKKATEQEEGNYKCVATLRDDKETHHDLVNIIKTNGMAPILGKSEEVPVKEKSPVTLKCLIIQAYPRPKITWQFKKTGETNFQNIPGTAEELRITSAELKHSGVYKCIAHNSKGTGEKETKLNVLITPKMTLLTNNYEVTTANVKYSSKISLMCQVTSHSAPNIIWKNSKGDRINPTQVNNLKTFDYTSHLIIPRFSKFEETYYCEASNEIDKTVKQVRIVRNNPFDAIKKEGETKVENGESATLLCAIKSDFGTKITWYRLQNPDLESNREIITNSIKYNILKNGAELRIDKVEEGVQGKYMCKASLADDNSVTQEYVIDVIINPAAPIMEKSEEVSVREKRPVTLKCLIIQAYPRPKISWQFRKSGETNFQNIPGTAEELSITSAELKQSGVYKCIAHNSKGTGEKETKLNVLITPKMTLLTNNYEVTTANVRYSSKISLMCQVTSHSAPNIIWKNSEGDRINPTQVNNLKAFDYTSHLIIPRFTKFEETYYCEASNEIDKTVKQVRIVRNNPFDAIKKEGETKVENGESATLLCAIKSDFGTKITWYRLQNPDLESNREIITNSIKYNILKNGAELRIDKVEEGVQGKYMCKASLADDSSVNQEYVIDVIINPAAPIMGKSEEVSVREKSPVTLKCLIIQAYPRPKITWQFKKTGETNFQNIPGTAEELSITSAELKHSGVYKCIAHNSKGTGEKETKLNVLVPPKITLLTNDQEVTTTRVEYSKTVSLKCYVTSHVIPDVIWKNGKGDIVTTSQTRTLKTFEFMSTLSVVNVRKNEKYTCEATNDITKSSKTVEIQVTTPLHVNNPDTITNITYGQKATIKCDIISLFPTKYYWSVLDKSGKTHVVQNSAKYSISADGSELTIKRMEPDLDGQYSCQATLLDDGTIQANHKTTVTVIMDLPEIEIVPYVLKVRQGNNAVLKCKILKGNPQPKLAWMVSDKLGNYKTLTESGDLIIQDTKYQDTGLYMCVAVSIAGRKEKTAQLTVEGPPVILSDSDIVIHGVVGDLTLIIPCVVVGHPKPNVSWLINGNESISGDRYIIEDGALVINNPRETDTKDYQCTAENTFGRVNKTFSTTILDAIDDDNFGNITYVYMLKGETKDFDCYSESQPGRWYEQTWPSNKTGTLTLSNVTTSNDGNYTCRTTNRRESKSHTYVVDVGYPPKLTRPEDEDFDWRGNIENLDCSVEMKPEHRTAKIEWLFNGKVLSVGSTVQRVVDWGNYTCRVSNYHGEASKTFIVSSTSCVIERNLLKNERSPLILDTSRTWSPFDAKSAHVSSYYPIDNGDKLFLSCHNLPERSNSFRNIPGKHEILAICDKEDNFLVDGKPYKFSELQCDMEIDPVIQKTGVRCSHIENSEKVQVGYRVEGAKNLLEVFNVCFDTNNKVPLYSEVTMMRPQNSDTLKKTTWHKFEAFGNANNKHYCDGKCCLESKQMVNSLDVKQGPAQSATYIEGLNTVPVWSCTRNVGWDEVEEVARSLLRSFGKFQAWTGAHQYTRNAGADALVPRYLWKLLKVRKTVLAVVWVNDPSPSTNDIFCNTSCGGLGIAKTDPYTYCCSLAEFRQHFVTPNDL